MTLPPEDTAPPRLDKASLAAALVMLAGVLALAASRIGGYVEYPLDDVYIHLAMASEIARGGYGVNAGEYASAASSALYPALLTPFPDSAFQRFLPLVWNIVGLGLTAWLWGRALIWAGYRGAAGWTLAILGPLFLGAVSTAYVGMEHTLHAAASLAIVFGLVRVLDEDRLNALLFAGLFFSPLFRFEGLALATVAVIVLALRGRTFAAVLGAVAAFVPIGAFVWYLLSLGLDPLPNSVQAKLVSNEDAAFSFLERFIGTFEVNLVKFGGLAIAGLSAMLLLVANLTATGLGRSTAILGALLVAAGIGVSAFVSFDLETHEAYARPALAGVVVGTLLLVMQLLRALRAGAGEARWIWPALGLAGAGFGHVALAQTGWMERYEHYAIAALAVALVLFSGRAEQFRRVAMVLTVLAIALTGARYAWKTTTQYHWGSRAIHLQQFQMQRFAKEFLNRNVAVNDLGWVAWGNPNYVLDLYGLANHEARRIRIFEPTPGWGGPLVREHDVSVVMIYHKFVGEAVAPDWVPLGMLVMNEARGYLGDDRVHFYAADFTEVPHAEAALREWVKTLLPDTCFVREGEDRCWSP